MPSQTHDLTVSAVIALYNGGDHIVEAIESILCQTIPVLEIIIVNDGSTDNSVEVIKAYLAKNSLASKKVRILEQPNSGQGVARNAGVAASRGNLIGLLDQDDSWEPTHCEELMAYFVGKPKLGWVYTDFNEFDEEGRFIRRNFLEKQEYEVPKSSIFGMIFQDLMMLPSSSLIRKEAFQSVGGFDSQFRGYEDDDLFFRLFVEGWSFKYHPEALVNYRIHPNNSSRNLTFPQSRMKFYRKYKTFLPEENPYFTKFYFHHLVPRMASAVIQDAAIASRDKWTEAHKFAADSLNEIYCDIGYGSRMRFKHFVVRHRMLLNAAVFVRSLKYLFVKNKQTF
ncbi:glycosyltransferase involved in cell wall biosynthesis [Aurantimicrobium minutum]|nr:glycosyltransferase involved in cell wall biosynthesis [Aurantimicrobium minutum]